MPNIERAKMFEAIMDSEPLLPPRLEKKRLSLLVTDSLQVMGSPLAKNNHILKPNDQLTKVNFLDAISPCVLKIIENNPEQIIISDKLQPHALYELMVVSNAPDIKSGIVDHTITTQEKIFNLALKFGNYAKIHKLYPYLAFNYDPQTKDRESGQSEKRFHFHLIGRTSEELEIISQKSTLLENISLLRRRRIADEYIFIASQLIYDNLNTTTPLESGTVINPRDVNNAGLLINLKDSWQTLNNRSFINDFQKIHNSMQLIYNELISFITLGQSDYWQRPILKDVNRPEFAQQLESITSNLGISLSSTIDLLYYLKKLKPDIIKKRGKELSKYRSISTFIFPLAGLSYNTAFFEENDQVYMLIKPQLFSDLGGAGLQRINGVITKIKRSVGEFSEQQMRKREEFQKEFIEAYNHQLE